MGNFCKYCGARVDGKTGLCPNCDAGQLRARRRQRNMIWIIAAVAVIAAALGAAAWYLLRTLDSGRQPVHDGLQDVPEAPEIQPEEPLEQDPAAVAGEPEKPEEPEEEPVSSLPADMPKQFLFYSGAGGWMSLLELHPDGTFSGKYEDQNAIAMSAPESMLDSITEGETNLSEFTGRFENMRRVSDVEYVMELAEITYAREPGEQELVDGMWMNYCEAYGLSGAKEVRVYLPGRSTSDFSDSLAWWLTVPYGLDALPDQLEGWCLYNVEEDLAYYESRPVQTAADIWQALLTSGDYLAYTADWAEISVTPTAYALLDIDGDGWEELILQGDEDWPDFHHFSVLLCDSETGEITPAQIQEIWGTEEIVYSTVGQYYGGITYSPTERALVYTELNNGFYFGIIHYRPLEAGKISPSFALGFERTEAGDTTYYLYRDGTSLLTEAAYQAYLDERESIEFQPIPDIGA